MKPIYTVIQEVVESLTGDTYNFIYGTQGRQNIEVDEKDFVGYNGVVLLDVPKPSPSIPNFLGVQVFNQQLSVTFAFPQSTSVDVTQDYINGLQERAKSSAREFLLKLRAYKDPSLLIRDMSFSSPVLFDSFLDICLCGAQYNFSITISDKGSICI